MASISRSLRHVLPWEIVITLLALTVTWGFFYQQYQTQQSLIAEQQTMALDVAYKATIETYRLDVETRFRLQVMQPEVLDLMAEALQTPEKDMPLVRGRLFRRLKPVYDELREIGLRQFQFHLADDRCLLRFQLPHVAGDPLFQLRPSLRIANTEKRPVTGLEVGRLQPGFRYVFPIARGDQHLGSVELSLPFERIQTNLSQLLSGGDFGLLLRKEAILGKVESTNYDKFVSTPIHPEFLMENPTLSRVTRNLTQSATVRALEPQLRSDPAVQRRMHTGESFMASLILDGQGYSATFLSLPDLTGKPVAYVIRFVKNDALHALRSGLFYQGWLATVLVLCLAATIHWLRRQRQQLQEDITQRKLAEANLRLYENIFHHSGEAILISDEDNCIVSVNKAFTETTGYTPDEIRGKNPRVLSSGQTPPETYQLLWASLHASGHWQGELTDRRKDGQTYPKWASISAIRSESGEITHYAASFVDISDRKAAEARIERLAHHDPLTGLLNRYSLESRLEQSLFAARRDGERLAVLFIDMDRFKNINDSLGHQVGDHMLQEVGRRLQASVRESDIVARQGGDEFVVVLTGLTEEHDADPAINKLFRVLGETYEIDGHSLHSTPSIGIALYPDHGNSVEDLLMNADAAMYCAKEHGRNSMQYFTAALTAAATERRGLEQDLHAAIAKGELELHYQPQIRARDGFICGVEALVRWRHPIRGLVLPSKFIPVAEESGLIESIGRWVLEEACRQQVSWRGQGIAELRVAVNLSAHQLRSPQLVDLVRESLQRYDLDAGSLELEVTESVAMESPDQAIDQLCALRDLGVHLSIDDFGTGYSSLAYLKHLPIQTLKLDQSFVRDIEVDANDATISSATIALAHALGLCVIAEGVESEAQARFLAQDHGCDILQGYLFSRPLPADLLEPLLKQRYITLPGFGER